MSQAPTPTPETPNRRSPVPLILLVLVLGSGAVYGGPQYLWGRTHVQTDDAYLTGNLVNVSPVIGGVLSEITVSEGDEVKQGQLLAKIDSDSQQAALAQAEAVLAAMKSQVPQAVANLEFQSRSTDAAIQRARAAEAIQQARTQSAQAQLSLTDKTSASQITQALKQLVAARAQAAQVGLQAEAAAATAAQLETQAETASVGLTGAKKAVETARKGVDVIAARLSGAEAEVEKTSRDAARYKSLLQKDAVTRQQFDSVHAQAEGARSNLAALKEQVAQAQSQVAQAELQVEQAASQVKSAEAQILQARAAHAAAKQAAQAAKEQAKVAEAGVGLAKAGGGQVAVQAGNLAATNAQNPQLAAELATASAGQSQVTAKREAVTAAKTQVDQAAAQVASARKVLANTTLTASTSGVVVRKTANVGAALSPGQTILTLTQGKTVWLTANFKETQIRDLRVGQPVVVHVDALPSKAIIGHIAVIGAATGATTSLLPPDNATGNFTKVVQRIPVRIALDGDLDGLSQGMSCVAVVDTSDKNAHPERILAGWDGKNYGHYR